MSLTRVLSVFQLIGVKFFKVPAEGADFRRRSIFRIEKVLPKIITLTQNKKRNVRDSCHSFMNAVSKSGREVLGPARQRFLLTFFAEKKVRRN